MTESSGDGTHVLVGGREKKKSFRGNMASYLKLVDAGRLLHRTSASIVKHNWTAVSAAGAMCLHRTDAPSARKIQPAESPATAGTCHRRTHRHGGDTVTRTLRLRAQHCNAPLWSSRLPRLTQSRMFGSQASGAGFSGEDGGESAESGGEESGGEVGGGGGAYNGPPMTALTPVMVPDVFPNVPLIAVSRNPVFPRFIKILEVRMTALPMTD